MEGDGRVETLTSSSIPVIHRISCHRIFGHDGWMDGLVGGLDNILIVNGWRIKRQIGEFCIYFESWGMKHRR